MACTAQAARHRQPIPGTMPATEGPSRSPPPRSAEIRRLFGALIITPLRARLANPAHAVHWSQWRRLHQGHARRSHYQHRLAIGRGP
jgi:hypothetical protein